MTSPRRPEIPARPFTATPPGRACPAAQYKQRTSALSRADVLFYCLKAFVYFLEESKSAGPLADVGEDAAVNVEDQPLDEVEARGEEDSGAAQILGLPPQRSAGVLATMNWSTDDGSHRLISRRGAVCGGGDATGSGCRCTDVVICRTRRRCSLVSIFRRPLAAGVGGNSLAAQLIMEQMLMILPPPCSIISGMTALGDDEAGVQGQRVDDLTELGSGHL